MCGDSSNFAVSTLLYVNDVYEYVLSSLLTAINFYEYGSIV